MSTASSKDVENMFKNWKENLDISIIKEPYEEVFGLTFLVEDPDGNIIRVSPCTQLVCRHSRKETR